jgi:hypothetical protein
MTTMSYDAYPLTNSNNFAYQIRTAIALLVGPFCIFSIFRYSTKIIEKAYKFHLLNMAIFISLCDLTFCFITRPHHLLPMNGFCFDGELNELLQDKVDLQLRNNIIIVSFYFWEKSPNFFEFLKTIHKNALVHYWIYSHVQYRGSIQRYTV